MDPKGTGRLRGFRAPGAGERPAPEGAPTGSTAGADVVATGPSTGSGNATGSGNGVAASGPLRWLVVAGAVLVVAIAVIATLAFRLGSTSAASDAAQSPTPTPTPRASATPLATTDLYRQVVPSVVLVSTSRGSLGTGTVVTDKGLILTANHVVSGGGTLSVTFADGTKARAEVASADPKTDSATLVPQKLPEVVVPAALGGSVAVGSAVVAIGNPLGLQDTTTTGVVSGLDRTSRTRGGSAVKGLIQFDAAVNPGSSGGPLLDAQGHVVGVVISIADPGGDEAWSGIGFAVPIGAALGGAGDGPGPGGGPQI